jgi:hypothetical protein
MRVRKLSAMVGAALVLGGCLTLYMMMDLAVFPSDIHDVSKSSEITKQLGSPCLRMTVNKFMSYECFFIKCLD